MCRRQVAQQLGTLVWTRRGHLWVGLGRTGPQMDSWAGSGPRIHHSLNISCGRAGGLAGDGAE